MGNLVSSLYSGNPECTPMPNQHSPNSGDSKTASVTLRPQTQGAQTQTDDYNTVQCYNCGRMGHTTNGGDKLDPELPSQPQPKQYEASRQYAHLTLIPNIPICYSCGTPGHCFQQCPRFDPTLPYFYRQARLRWPKRGKK